MNSILIQIVIKKIKNPINLLKIPEKETKIMKRFIPPIIQMINSISKNGKDLNMNNQKKFKMIIKIILYKKINIKR